MPDDMTPHEQMREALQARGDEAACEACLSQLEAYITAQLDGRNYLALFPQTARHLDGCLSCAAAYARLYRMELAAAAETLPQLQQPRLPDLAFLSAVPDQQPPLTDLLRTAVTRLQNRIRLHLSADLLPRLQPPPTLAPTRAPADAQRYAEQLFSLDPGEALRADLPLTLTVYRDGQQPQNCLVEITVAPSGRAWPNLAGMMVILVLPDQRREQPTNPWGVAAFEQVPVAELSELVIEVQL